MFLEGSKYHCMANPQPTRIRSSCFEIITVDI